jgi:ubiquinone/menaquinone biosynthesis C-methylase UbiE
MARNGLGATSNFAPVAARYDATRDVPSALLKACYERLLSEGLLPSGGVILDAGCGTGQISLPLAEMGFDVRGYDVSREMVAIARAKAPSQLRARYTVADARSLPDADGCIGAVVVSKLFQHVENWQAVCRELVRVLRPGGCIFHIADRGAFGNPVRRHFAARADAQGHTRRFLGLHPRERKRLVDCFVALGCESVPVDATDLAWQKRISYADALDQIRERLFAEYWYMPADVYELILRETDDWVAQQPEGGATVEVMNAYLAVDVFRKSASGPPASRDY